LYQNDNTTAAASPPAAPTGHDPGYFTGGNPSTGVAPTILSPHWLNTVMLELLNVLVAAGLDPSRTDATQVADSIILMIRDRTGCPQVGGPRIVDDANDIVSSGAWRINDGADNRPTGANELQCVASFAALNTDGMVIGTDTTTGQVYHRYRNESGWQGWREITTTAV